jgi:hypothetical protein
MTALETEIATIESGLSKLQAQRRIAQMNANSDEFIHHNLRLAMQYLDKAPAEAQKLLMQSMIRDIVIYNEDKMAINMFISDSLQENLPNELQELMPQKVKRPTQKSEALTTNSRSSADCLNWLPKSDTNRVSQVQYIQLLVKIYKRRNRRLELSIDQPFPAPTPQLARMPKNIVKIALDVKAYTEVHPGHSYSLVAENFNVSRARVSQLLKIINNLPTYFIKKLQETKDPIMLRRFSGKRLLKLASLTNPARIDDAIKSLTPIDSI